jgi:hypothetical protein
MCFFNLAKKNSWIEILFWQLLEMLEISNTYIGSHRTLFAVYHTCNDSCGKLWQGTNDLLIKALCKV